MAKSLLQLVQTVCKTLGLPSPSSTVMTNTDATVAQILALANEEGADLTGEYAWSRLTRVHTFSTAASTETYALPSDYDHMSRQTQWDRTNHWELQGPVNAQDWQMFKSGISSTGPRRRFRIYNNLIYLDPIPADVATLAFEYTSNAWILDNDGTTRKAEFSEDTDTILLPEALFIKGVKLRLWNLKGFDTSLFAQEYDREKSRMIAQDGGGRRALRLGGGRNGFPFLSHRNYPDSGFGS